MKKQGGGYRQATPVADFVSELLNPVIERRAGMTLDLISSWETIAGEKYASHSRPEKLNWPRQASDDDPFEPATLVLACEGAYSLFIQHDSDFLIKRINTYFGFAAVGRLKLVQKTITRVEKRQRRAAPQLSKQRQGQLHELLAEVEDPQLKQALEKLGRGVFSSGS